jgi:AbrB family looped-hinge helix DNA binding protein
MRITERGQLTIPKKLRDKHGIHPSTDLELLDTPEGLLIVKRIGSSPFRKFLGKASAQGLPRSSDAFISLVREGTARPTSRRKRGQSR